MSENVSLTADKDRQHCDINGYHMHVNARTGPEALHASAARAQAKPKQPFLQSGSGLKRRQQASMSEKRYIPKGGFVLDFAADTVAAPPRSNGSMRHTGAPKRSSPGPASGRGVQDKSTAAAAVRAYSPVRRAGSHARLSSSSSSSQAWPAAALAQPASSGMQPGPSSRGRLGQPALQPLPPPAGVRAHLRATALSTLADLEQQSAAPRLQRCCLCTGSPGYARSD
jgi:hypothetical protein